MTKTITLGQGDYCGDDNRVLQRAVDDLSSSGGGVVEVPAGYFQMHNTLQLRDKVRVIGEKGTVLQKVPGSQSPLKQVAGFGHYEFTVDEPEKFSVGMGVLIRDSQANGFYSTVATIVAQEGEYFYIDRPFNHDYHRSRGGTVTSVFSLIEGVDVRDASVQNITLDGNWPQEGFYLNGCRGGGVFLLGAHGALVEGVEVCNFHGDALSFQQCTDIAIVNCFLHHNFGGGLHPGSGSVRYLLQGNCIEDNGGCGIFYCLRTTHSSCEGNQISRNGADGISIGERDTDHIISGNMIVANKGAGILLRKAIAQSGDRVWIENNQLTGNNTAGDGAEVVIEPGLCDVCITDNCIGPEQGPAFSVATDCSNISIYENRVSGRGQKYEDITGESQSVQGKLPTDFPPIGPGAAGANAARHLNVVNLPATSALPEIEAASAAGVARRSA